MSRAALILGVAQQSVSERIRRLERRLGVDLFVRLPHGMVPSAAGYRFLPYTERILVLSDEALTALQGDDVVRVIVQKSVSVALMPHLKIALEDLNMRISEEVDCAQALASVTDGASDVAFGTFPGIETSATSGVASERPAASTENGNGDASEQEGAGFAPQRRVGLIIERAFDDPVVCVAPPDHPLADRRGLHFSDLTGLNVRTDASADLPGPVGSTNGSVELRLSPRATVSTELAEGSLVQLDVIDLPEWVVPVHVAYRDTDSDRPFVSTMRAAFARPLPTMAPELQPSLDKDVA